MFNIGDEVERIEQRETVKAVVINVDTSGEETNYELEYEEGGTGWWPESSIKKV